MRRWLAIFALAMLALTLTPAPFAHSSLKELYLEGTEGLDTRTVRESPCISCCFDKGPSTKFDRRIMEKLCHSPARFPAERFCNLQR